MHNHFMNDSSQHETAGLSVSHRLRSYSNDELSEIISSFLCQHEYAVLSQFLDDHLGKKQGLEKHACLKVTSTSGQVGHG